MGYAVLPVHMTKLDFPKSYVLHHMVMYIFGINTIHDFNRFVVVTKVILELSINESC